MYKNQPIKEWIVEDRPREKVLQKGMQSLSDSELLALLLGTGFKNSSAVDLSKEILSKMNYDLDLLARMNFNELCKFKGVGQAKAIILMACFELSKRKNNSVNKDVILNSSEKSYERFKPYFEDLNVEEFHVALLNQRNKLLKTIKISQGGITFTSVDIRLIFKAALEIYATRIILIHNHPSGNLSPSVEDDKITKRIVELGKIMEINVLDHIIITNNGYFSYADKNLL